MLEPTELFPEVPNLYEFPSVHADMLFDQERVDKYSQAIGRLVKPGDVVADIGTGTGLLAFLSLQAGAERVHAIERSPAIEWAKKLADHHGYSGRIFFHNVDSRQVELPEKVDLVVSELIGHMAFEEGMVEALFDARERFLRPGGSTIPQEVFLSVALVSENDVYKEYVECWQPVKGIDYSLLRDDALRACYVTRISDRDLLSLPATLFAVDLARGEKPVLCGGLTLKACRPGEVNGIALWFDAVLAPGVRLSSGPWADTHWQQCFAPVAQPISVAADDHIAVRLEMKLRTREDDRFEFALDMLKET